MSLLYASECVQFNSSAPSCDCLAHVLGNAADHPDREPRYPSGMSDAEWAAIRPFAAGAGPAAGQRRAARGLLPRPAAGRDPLPARGRDLLAGDARGLSRLGPLYAFFCRWREQGLIPEFHDRLRGRVLEREGREAEPTAGIIDAQSVKAAASVPSVSRAYDGGKKVGGRKRHIVTGCLGLLLVIAVTAATIGNRDGPADPAAPHAPRHHPRLGRRRLHRRPRRLMPGQTRSDLSWGVR